MVLALQELAPAAVDPLPIGGQAVLTVVIGVALLAGVSWLLRRGSSWRRGALPVTVETAVPLGERRSLVIVAVEGRRLLLGLTPGSVSLVAELQPPFARVLDTEVSREGGA